MHILLFFSGFLPKGLQRLARQLLNCLFAANTQGINYSFLKILLSLFFTALGLKLTTLQMYFVLYKQITGPQASQTGCATKFRCQTTPFKRLVTEKKQPGRPGRPSGTKSGRSIEEIAEMEGVTPAKRAKATLKATPKATLKQSGGRG